VRDVTKSYALGATAIEVLRGVSLEVPRRQVCAVMGPSGVGKSTLLSCIAGLAVPDGGHVEVLGRDVTRLDEDERTLLRRRHVGIVYQFFNLVPTLSAVENVMLPYLIDDARPDMEAVSAALARVDMAKRGDHLPAQLSGGEMQLVSIARAIVRRPALLLADEPTGNLNVATGRRVMALLADVARESASAMLLVTHSPEDAARADRVVFMKDGALCADAELAGSEVSSQAIHQRLRALGI
jgi:putative ABC transport system ATP-binding protein